MTKVREFAVSPALAAAWLAVERPEVSRFALMPAPPALVARTVEAAGMPGRTATVSGWFPVPTRKWHRDAGFPSQVALWIPLAEGRGLEIDDAGEVSTRWTALVKQPLVLHRGCGTGPAVSIWLDEEAG